MWYLISFRKCMYYSAVNTSFALFIVYEMPEMEHHQTTHLDLSSVFPPSPEQAQSTQ